MAFVFREGALVVEAVAAPLLFIVALAAGRVLKRRAGVRLGWEFQLLCVVFALWLPLEIGALDFPHRLATLRLLRAANILLGTFFFLALIRRYYWELWFQRHRQAQAPKFLSQLFGLGAFIVALFVVVGGIYGQSVQGAIFGSTVVVGIVGFAMQDLLGNIIAGIALEIGKPFKTGDWLKVDGVHAEIIEVNWRSTRLRTNDDIYLDIPNKTIVGTTITNLTYPNRAHAQRIVIGFDYQHPPNAVKDIMAAAAAEAHGVLKTPAPRVFLRSFGDSAVSYEIKFWIEDEALYNDILDAVHTNIWYAAQRHQIRIPYPIRTLQIQRPATTPSDKLATLRACVHKQPILQLLNEAQMEKIIKSARFLRFGRGEVVITQGTAGESMFILLEGAADISVTAHGQQTLVATLRSGDTCGEMSLLTGEPRNATVIARVDCEMCEIDKAVFAEILQENAALVQQLGELLAQRRMETEGIRASSSQNAPALNKQREYTESFLKKLYSFFEL